MRLLCLSPQVSFSSLLLSRTCGCRKPSVQTSVCPCVCVCVCMSLCVCVFCTRVCGGACVEVDSDTEAVVGDGFQLGCIYCKMRGEVRAKASVDWYYRSSDEREKGDIYRYQNQRGEIMDPRFEDRLAWNGSKGTDDLQDGSIYILNVTYNDTGTYTCNFTRTLTYNYYEVQANNTKTVQLNVVSRLTRGMASILSEVMMYVSIVGLQFWLLVEMIYCYRKIAAAGEEALRESEAEYLAIASESKDNCAASVPVAE
uniref:Sodium channel regulatory subunit beta-3 n=1 Tax=Oryzias latipes TaxID=8090 RepID=A0A3P9KMT1_ORYLA